MPKLKKKIIDKNEVAEIFLDLHKTINKLGVNATKDVLVKARNGNTENADLQFIFHIAFEHWKQDKYYFTMDILYNKNLRGEAVECRNMIFVMLYRVINLSAKDICKRFVGVNYTSVWSAIDKHKKLDPQNRVDKIHYDRAQLLIEKAIKLNSER